MAYENLIPSSATRPVAPATLMAKMSKLIMLLELNVSFSTWLLIGACLQATLVLLLPPMYALTPAAILLALRFLDTLLLTTGIRSNFYMRGSFPGKSNAQVYNEKGELVKAGQEKIAVFLLGAKTNHPLGMFAPGFSTVDTVVELMTAELQPGQNQDSGFLGQTVYSRKDGNAAGELLFISYWRSMDDVHDYATTATHRMAVDWWVKNAKTYPHIAFWHEVYEADKGQWENIYVNHEPIGLGATTFLKKDGKLANGSVGAEWINPILDANKGPLRTAAGRRGLGGK
ncbi:MAG: hypothetical protein M1838_001048 [Thelocarpon superellum]|nr:MAG: hypothetical protein M1838_001048 [Thelocarpon superellum]